MFNVLPQHCSTDFPTVDYFSCGFKRNAGRLAGSTLRENIKFIDICTLFAFYPHKRRPQHHMQPRHFSLNPKDFPVHARRKTITVCVLDAHSTAPSSCGRSSGWSEDNWCYSKFPNPTLPGVPFTSSDGVCFERIF